MNLHISKNSPQPSLRGSNNNETIRAHVNDRGNPNGQSRARGSLKIFLFVGMILVGQVGWAQWSTNGTNVYYNGGNVGVGTTAPNGKLHLYKSSTGNSDATIAIDGPTNSERAIIFRDNGTDAWWFGRDNNGDMNSGLGFWRSGVGFALALRDNGNIGIGTSDPKDKLHLANVNGGGIRLGGIGEVGTTNVPLGSQAASYSIDFSGYRDVTPDQIGARIAALRFNVYGAGTAYVQNTALAFYTNPSGWTPGTTDLYERMRIAPDGNVGIGTTTPDAKLAVKGTIHTQEVKVDMIGWSDYVFDADYDLPSLEEVKKYIDQHHHLPEIPSAKEVVENGIMLGEMNKLLVKKMEEMTLYMIEANERIINLEEKLSKLEPKTNP